MPTDFFRFAWPLAFSLIFLAGSIVILAGLTTLVTAIARARQLGKDRDDQAQPDMEDGNSHRNIRSHTVDGTSSPIGVVETVTTDGIHYIPHS